MFNFAYQEPLEMIFSKDSVIYKFRNEKIITFKNSQNEFDFSNNLESSIIEIDKKINKNNIGFIEH